MAKKKTKPLERDQRPEFLAALDATPEDDDARVAQARRAAALFNDAVYIGDEARAAAAVLMFEAVVYRMNGDTFFGCAADGGSQKRLFADLAAVPGHVPAWGQSGQCLFTVEGVQMLATVKPCSLGGVIYVDLDALNLNAPFISSTGFRNLMLWPDSGMGQTFAQAVRAQVEAVLVEQGGPVLIGPAESCRQKPAKPPAWLGAALAAVAGNGQMAMFSEETGGPVRGPMSGAERQQRRREKVRQLKETEGLKPVMLNARERLLLSDGLDLLNEHRTPKGAEAAYQLALLRKLTPGADWRPEQARVLAGLKWNFDAHLSHAQGEQRRAEKTARIWQARAEAAEKVLCALGSVQVESEWQQVEELPEESAALLAAHGPVVLYLEAMNRVREIAKYSEQHTRCAIERGHEIQRLQAQLEAAKAGGFILPANDAN